MKLGLWCGSLNEASSNAAALDVVESRAAELGVMTSTIEGLGAIPAFVPTQVDEPPASVADFRAQLDAVDAVIIAAPEYAAGVAGSTKNVLDWLVGASTLYHKPVGVLSAGTTGGAFAIEHLVRTISWQGGLVMATLGIAAPKTKVDERGRFVDGATLSDLRQFSNTLVGACQGSPADRLVRLTEVVSSYEIDPVRFGQIR
jgi:NAD(P)H-dependent FMN reductase